VVCVFQLRDIGDRTARQSVEGSFIHGNCVGSPDGLHHGASRRPNNGEWALGRWEGSIVSIGTSSGTAELSQSPRTLIIQKNDAGAVTCLWFISNDPKSRQWTKRCTVGPNGISLETAASSVVELSRSGRDGLQGRFVATGATGASGAGMSGTQVHLNRVR